MERYKNKKSFKSVGVLTRLFNLFSDLFGGEKIKKSFKSVVMSFQGKSKSQIEEHFKMEEYIKEMRLKEQAKKDFDM